MASFNHEHLASTTSDGDADADADADAGSAKDPMKRSLLRFNPRLYWSNSQ